MTKCPRISRIHAEFESVFKIFVSIGRIERKVLKIVMLRVYDLNPFVPDRWWGEYSSPGRNLNAARCGKVINILTMKIRLFNIFFFCFIDI